MANLAYRKLATGSWMRQDGGGPCYFQISQNSADSLWYIQFSYNGADWFIHSNGQTTPALAQQQLDNYCASLNAGTATA
jgi:hypothetical protein